MIEELKADMSLVETRESLKSVKKHKPLGESDEEKLNSSSQQKRNI